jgi:hypothetical protein
MISSSVMAADFSHQLKETAMGGPWKEGQREKFQATMQRKRRSQSRAAKAKTSIRRSASVTGSMRDAIQAEIEQLTARLSVLRRMRTLAGKL